MSTHARTTPTNDVCLRTASPLRAGRGTTKAAMMMLLDYGDAYDPPEIAAFP
jgi:hypothetical protein